jgi:hypothetical protein
VNSTNYEAPYYIFFSSILLLLTSYVQILSSAPIKGAGASSHINSARRVTILMCKKKSKTTNPEAKYTQHKIFNSLLYLASIAIFSNFIATGI